MRVAWVISLLFLVAATTAQARRRTAGHWAGAGHVAPTAPGPELKASPAPSKNPIPLPPARPVAPPLPTKETRKAPNNSEPDAESLRLTDSRNATGVAKEMQALWKRSKLGAEDVSKLLGKWAGVCTSRTGQLVTKAGEITRRNLEDTEFDMTPGDRKMGQWANLRSNILEGRFTRTVSGVRKNGEPVMKNSLVISPPQDGVNVVEAEGNARPMSVQAERASYGNQETSIHESGRSRTLENFEARIAQLDGETVLVTRGSSIQSNLVGDDKKGAMLEESALNHSYCVLKRATPQ